MWLIVYSNNHAPLTVRPIYSSSKQRTAQIVIFLLVAMIELEKCCITSACLQWLCHSGERIVARGPLVFFFFFFCCCCFVCFFLFFFFLFFFFFFFFFFFCKLHLFAINLQPAGWDKRQFKIISFFPLCLTFHSNCLRGTIRGCTI